MSQIPTTPEELKQFKEEYEAYLKTLDLQELLEVLQQFSFEAEQAKLEAYRTAQKLKITSDEEAAQLAGTKRMAKAAFYALKVMMIASAVEARVGEDHETTT